MVLLNVKRGDRPLFIVETTCPTSVDEVTKKLVEMSNMRLRLVRLCRGCEELATFGPCKPPGKEGIDTYTNEDGTLKCGDSEADQLDLASKYPNYNMDPSGRRTADCQKQVDARVNMTTEMYQAQIDLIRGAVTIAFPMGLPLDDPVQCALDGIEDLSGSQDSKEVLDEKEGQLWWAGKQMLRDGQVLSDYIGKNEKTKLVIKLTKAGGGQPTREAAVDEETQKRMMAYYHKKQEQMKKLEEDDEDDYANSAWANPKGLKNSLQGMGQVRMR
eukprot:SAG22_NODE_1424_length_4461_cov_1.785420_2_plen_272_part_00